MFAPVNIHSLFRCSSIDSPTLSHSTNFESPTRPDTATNMSRPFDSGKARYSSVHRSESGPVQHTRHIIADSMLQHYGASARNYASSVAEHNYRMGSVATNARDSRLDRHIIGHAFYDAGRAGGYDAQELTRATASHAGLSLQQQRNGISQRFQVAKQAYAETGEHKYFMMQKDLRDIADNHLGADLRGFRLSSRK